MVSKDTTSNLVIDTPLNPILALSLFLTEQQPTVYDHSHHQDPTIVALYKISLSAMAVELPFESNFITTMKTACTTNEKLFRKLEDYRIECNTMLKRRYSYDDDDTTSEDLEYPDKLPMKGRAITRNGTRSEEDYNFIVDFKKEIKGRMNWAVCLQLGYNKNVF
ncbi:hypothetical protein J3Q64DRAFT_1810473 [Phycomyces blakesleeanus]|uniref:Uncharacterized protein n=1 Tax=Phycomyces blakesleeanus TaxID=4837 RepID=A0ABR3AT32_PHYBL